MEPAQSIIRRLGGTSKVADLTGAHRTRVWRWTQPKIKSGTGGLIPLIHIPALIKYGRSIGVQLDAGEFLPVSSDVGEEK